MLAPRARPHRIFSALRPKRGEGWGGGIPAALAITALTALTAITLPATPAHAAPIEPRLSLGAIAPSSSPYRNAAQQLGYGTGYPRLGFEAEVGALVPIAFGSALSLGPIARLHVERQASAYDGLDALATDAALVGLRQELVVYGWPRFFLWLDESLGLGRIGAGDAHKTLVVGSVTGGLGVRLGEQPAALRLRLGYAWTPTATAVTDVAGKYNFGGILFALDGVLRVD